MWGAESSAECFLQDPTFCTETRVRHRPLDFIHNYLRRDYRSCHQCLFWRLCHCWTVTSGSFRLEHRWFYALTTSAGLKHSCPSSLVPRWSALTSPEPDTCCTEHTTHESLYWLFCALFWVETPQTAPCQESNQLVKQTWLWLSSLCPVWVTQLPPTISPAHKTLCLATRHS